MICQPLHGNHMGLHFFFSAEEQEKQQLLTEGDDGNGTSD